MNGNLSLKKGLISEMTDKELTTIAEMLYVWAGFNEADITKKEDVENKLTREQFLETCEILTDEEMDRLYVSALIIRELAARLETAESKADYALTEKADKADTFTIKEMEEKLSDKADKVDSYTKEEVINKLSEKEDIINKTNTISDTPSTDKYPSEVAVFEKLMLWNSELKSYVGSYTNEHYYNKTEINNMDLANKVWVVERIGMLSDVYYRKFEVDEKFDEFRIDIEAFMNTSFVDSAALESVLNDRNYATKEELNDSIKSAILDSWEAAV